MPILSMILLSNISSFAACTPVATTGNVDQNFTCEFAMNGEKFFYGGSDIVELNSATIGTGTRSGSFWLDNSLAGDATDGNDTFIANHSEFVWVLSFGGDDKFEINYSKFSNLYADTNPGHGVNQRGNDTIIIQNSVSNGWILGGNDNDNITIKNSKVSFVASGYSINYLDLWGTDYTPHDGNDTIILDNVDFGETNYYAPYAHIPGSVGSGKGDDTIVFKNGGIAYGVSAGHGNDKIVIENYMLFNDCNYTNDRGNITYCGIYSDEPYESEANATTIALHGDDTILLHAGDLSDIVINAGHGSDLTVIDDKVLITGTTIDGGDDRSIADGFNDTLVFNKWMGDLNGSLLLNWGTIIFDNGSTITLVDNTLSTGNETNILSGVSYGLILQNNASLVITHTFNIDGNLYNNAKINMQADSNQPTSILNIENNYKGNIGTIYLDTMLNDASISISDKIVIKEDASGTTLLSINNVNGLGGQTTTGDNEGILLVEVYGDSADNAFELAYPLHAGDYTYTLVKGSNGNWYLQSTLTTIPPLPDNRLIASNSYSIINSESLQQKQLPTPIIVGDCSEPYDWILVQDTQYGELVLNQTNGSYTYQPHAGNIKNDSFTYKIASNNCSESNVATVSIVVATPSTITNQASDSGSIFGRLSILLTIFGNLVAGLYFMKRNRREV